MVDTIQNDRFVLGRDATGEATANRDPHALDDLFFQARGRGGDELAGRVVEQEHGRGVGSEDNPEPVQELGEHVVIVKT